MCSQGQTAHVVVNVNEVVDVDECIAPLVRALNDAGIGTVASCCGHGHRHGNIALADGRELVLVRSYEEGRRIDSLLPDIHGNEPRTPDRQAPEPRGCPTPGACSCPGYESAVNDLYNSLAVAVPLTVAAALMLPEVRSGRKWIEYERPNRCGGTFTSVVAVDDGIIRRTLWPSQRDPFYDWKVALKTSDLDATCTLVDPTPPEGKTEEAP